MSSFHDELVECLNDLSTSDMGMPDGWAISQAPKPHSGFTTKKERCHKCKAPTGDSGICDKCIEVMHLRTIFEVDTCQPSDIAPNVMLPELVAA